MKINGLGDLSLHVQIRGISNPAQSEFDRVLGQAVTVNETTTTSAAGSALPISEILEKGIYEYARERRLEKMRAEIRKQIMAEMGVTEESIAQLDTAARAELLQRIEEEVEQRLQERLRKEREAEAQLNRMSDSAIAAR